MFVSNRLGPQWSEEICYKEPLKEIPRLPPKPALPPLISTASSSSNPLPLGLPKRLQDDPCRRDSGMSTGSSEMESSDAPDHESIGPVPASIADPEISRPGVPDMAGWWEPRVKVNLADQLPGKFEPLKNN